MKRNTELWILSHEDVKKGLIPEWETAILETMNALVNYEHPMRLFTFQIEEATGNKEHLIEFVTKGNYLLVLQHKPTQDVIGTIMLRPAQYETDMVGLLGFLHIVPKYQRKGYGKALVLDAEHVAKKMGCNLVRLSVLGENTNAKHFYDAMQYSCTQVLMAKSI
jgi:ribosomal protein S18 acetylase RimI-like enzyme